MSKGVNKAILIGRVGSDPDIKETSAGSMIANLSIATTESWKDKQTRENVDKTEWHRVVFFNKLAEIVSQYVKKGSLLYIDGKLQTRKWQDKSGNDRYTTEIVANSMQMLGGRQSEGLEGKPKNEGISPSNGFNDDIPF